MNNFDFFFFQFDGFDSFFLFLFLKEFFFNIFFLLQFEDDDLCICRSKT